MFTISRNCEEDVILDKIKHVFNATFLHSPCLQTRNKKHILAGGLVLFVDKGMWMFLISLGNELSASRRPFKSY